MPKIILVDDNKLTLAMEKTYLEAKNFRVFATTSHRELQAMARRLKPDLIVLDYELGDKTGDEVCRAIRADPVTRATPVLILTAHDREDVKARCREAGANGFVRKAAGRESFLDSVASVLGLPQRRHARVPCTFRVELVSDRKSQGTAHNISQLGIYLTVQQVIPTGVLIDLLFALPDSSTEVRAKGEVVRNERLVGGFYGYGIQFLNLDPANMRALKRFAAE